MPLQAIQTDGRPSRLTYDRSTDQVWVEQTLDQPHLHPHDGQQLQQQQQQGSDISEVVVIRQASEHLLHRTVHVDRGSELQGSGYNSSDARLTAVPVRHHNTIRYDIEMFNDCGELVQ